jgi:hypothetical protein
MTTRRKVNNDNAATTTSSSSSSSNVAPTSAATEKVGFLREFVYSLFDEVPAHSIVFHRIFWGIVMAYEIYTYIAYDNGKAYEQLVRPSFLFHYYGFDW